MVLQAIALQYHVTQIPRSVFLLVQIQFEFRQLCISLQLHVQTCSVQSTHNYYGLYTVGIWAGSQLAIIAIYSGSIYILSYTPQFGGQLQLYAWLYTYVTLQLVYTHLYTDCRYPFGSTSCPAELGNASEMKHDILLLFTVASSMRPFTSSAYNVPAVSVSLYWPR